jgi:hypothetical protein
MFFKHVDRLRVDIDRATCTGGITFIWPTDVRGFSIDVHSADVRRTLVQVVGPAYNGVLGTIRGTSTDDLVNLCGNVYTEQTDTCGDVQNVTIGTIEARNVGAAALKINPCAGLRVDGINVGAVLGSAQVGLYIGEDAGRPETTGGAVGTIDIAHLEVAATSTELLLVGCAGDSVNVHGRASTANPVNVQGSAATLRRLRLAMDFVGGIATGVTVTGSAIVTNLILDRCLNGNTTAGGKMVNVSGTAPIVRHLILGGCHGEMTADSQSLVTVDTGGLVEQVTLADCRVVFLNNTGPNYGINLTGSGVINRINVSGGYYQAGAQFIRNTSTAAQAPIVVEIANTVCTSMNRFINNQPATAGRRMYIYLSNVSCTGLVNKAIFTNSGLLRIFPTSSVFAFGGNLSPDFSDSAVQRSGTEDVQVFEGAAFPVDLSVLTRSQGQMAYNSNPALTPVSGTAAGLVGICVCDGTTWKNLVSGSTY